MNFFKSKIFVNIIYGIMAFLTIILFLMTYFVNRERIDIPVLGTINPSLRINVEIPKEDIKNVHFYINNYEVQPYIWRNPNTYCAFEIGARNIYSITFKGDKDSDISKIKNIVVFVGDKMFYYDKNDISNFKKTKDNRYIFPPSMKYYKNSIYINDAGGLKHLTYGILSVFYNWKFYLIPFLFLFITCLIYVKNKDKINLGFNLFKQNAIWFILIFAFLIRVCDLGFNFWSDELYTITCASYPTDSFIWTFKDPGNPPFFFILAKIWMMIFGISEVKCRMLTIIFSVLTVYFIYKFLKENLDKNGDKIGLLGAFLYSVNIYSIHNARDFRVYALGGLLCILSFIVLYRIVKENKNKDYIIYAILIACMINSHYYQAFILLANFIYGMFLLDKKGKIKFFISNFTGGLTFLPFFIMTALRQSLLNSNFNELMPPNLLVSSMFFSKFFTSPYTAVAIMLLAFCFLTPVIYKKCFNEDKKLYNILFFATYVLLFVFVAVHLFSQIKPITKDFYYTNMLPVFAIMAAGLFFLPFRRAILRKIIPCVLFIFIFSGYLYIKKVNLLMITFDPLIEYTWYDSKQFRDEGKKIGIFIHDAQQKAVRDIQLKLDPKYVRNLDSYLKFFKGRLKGDEKIITYYYGMSPYEAHKLLKESNVDVAYMRLENKKFVKFSMEIEPEYQISVIRCNKDIIVGRFEKK